MSYILDALRRADAERERGEVPSLRTQQYGALPGDDAVPRRPRLLVGVILVLVLALAATLAWNFWGAGDAGHRAAAQGTVTATAPPAVIDAAPPPALAASALPALTPAAAGASLAPTSPAVAPRHVNAPALPPTARATAPERRQALRAAAVAASAPASSTDADTGKLPDALRRELPALAFGGASYSSDAASRMVIFNGRVFHEGDTIAPQLVLRQIKLKAAVLVYKGYRYEMAY
jgi:general secretion pathway protein B